LIVVSEAEYKCLEDEEEGNGCPEEGMAPEIARNVMARGLGRRPTAHEVMQTVTINLLTFKQKWINNERTIKSKIKTLIDMGSDWGDFS
jgi:hypothetical protein